MGALKLFLVLFVFNNYFNHAHSKSVVTDLSDDAEEKSLMEAFSALLSSAESDKIVTRSVEETTFSDAEIKEVVDILLKKHPEAAPYLTTDIVSSKIKETSAPAKYLIKYIFDGLRGIDRKVDEERLKAVIGKVMSETSALATAIKNEFANKAKKQPANANAASTGPVIRLLGDTDQSNSITEDSIARVIAKFRNSRMISNSPLNSPKAAGVIAKQLNGLQPLARTVIKTLIDKFLNKFGIGQSRKSQVGLGISTSGTWRTQSESAPDARELGSDEPAQVNIVTSDTSGAAARSDIGGSGFGNQGASAGQDNVAFSDASDTKIAAQVSTKNNEVNAISKQLLDAIRKILKENKEIHEILLKIPNGSNRLHHNLGLITPIIIQLTKVLISGEEAVIPVSVAGAVAGSSSHSSAAIAHSNLHQMKWIRDKKDPSHLIPFQGCLVTCKT